MNLKLDLGFNVPVSKMSRNVTSVTFLQLTPAWWHIVMK